MQSWIFLAGAIVLEVAGTSSMKISDGFSKFVPSVFIFIFYGLSFFSLTFAIKEIDISIGYAVWSGIGTALIATIGFLYFKEPLTLLKVISLLLIVIGVIGLNLSTPSR